MQSSIYVEANNMCVNSLLISRATKLNLVLGAELARGDLYTDKPRL